MSANKSKADTLFAWLKANLGPKCLAPLTGQDAAALKAAVMVVELSCYSDDEQSCYTAFALLVLQMQPHCRELAFHAIAHSREWQTRGVFWMRAGLAELENVRRCAFEG